MGFKEKLMRIATGKTPLERKQEQAAMSEIRKEARAEGLRERRKHIVKLAVEKEKVKYEREIKRLREPKQSFFGKANYGSPFGEPRSLGTRTVTIGKGKKKRKIQQTYTPKVKRYSDLIGFDFPNQQKKFKII